MRKKEAAAVLHVRMSHSRNMRTGTTTIDVRENTFRRYVLDRRTETLDTTYRTVRWKVSAGYGVKRENMNTRISGALRKKEKSVWPKRKPIGQRLNSRQPAKEYRRRTADASAAFRAEQGRHT